MTKTILGVFAFALGIGGAGCGASPGSEGKSTDAIVGTSITTPAAPGTGWMAVSWQPNDEKQGHITLDGGPVRNCAVFPDCDLPPILPGNTVYFQMKTGRYTFGIEDADAAATVDVIESKTSNVLFYGKQGAYHAAGRTLQEGAANTIDLTQTLSPDADVAIADVDDATGAQTDLGVLTWGQRRTVPLATGHSIVLPDYSETRYSLELGSVPYLQTVGIVFTGDFQAATEQIVHPL